MSKINWPLIRAFLIVCVIIVLIFLLPIRISPAQEHHGHPAEHMELHRQFYSTWMMPDNRSISCCHNEDCAPAEAHQINGQWVARKEGDTGDFTPIPAQKVEHERDSPDGRNHLCGRRYGPGAFSVFCFISGAGG